MGEDDFSWLMDYFGPQSDYSGGVNLGDLGGGILGDYDPRLDPNPGGAYDPRLDPGLQGGGSPPGGFPGVPAPGGGGSNGAPNGQRGLFTNPDGSINWASLLGVLAPLAGGAYAANQTGKANQQMQDSIKQANAQITSTLGGNQAMYQPYQAAGAQGLAGLMAQPPSNIAGRYKPLGASNGFSLANVARGK